MYLCASTFSLISAMISFLSQELPMDQIMKNNKEAEHLRNKITEYFLDAFLEDFRSGPGRRAVHSFIEVLVSLTGCLQDGSFLPSCNVMYKSSPTVSCSLDVVTSPSVTTRSGSCDTSSVETPTPKKRKMGKTSKPSAGVKANKRGTDTDGPLDMRKNADCDIVVSTRDIQLHSGKYLLLIEIQSYGVSTDTCVRKLFEEMIFVLQAQTKVYGLVFSPKTIYLLMTSRNPQSGEIEIGRKEYPMLFFETYFFNVHAFQMMTMDIFSVLVDGLVTIEV